MVPYTGTQLMELQVVYPNDPPPRNAVHNLVRCIKDPSPPKPALKSGIVTVWADFSRKKSRVKRKSGEHHRNGRAMRYKQRTTMMLWAAVVSCAFCVSFSSRPTTAFVAPSPTIYQAMSRRMEVNSRRHASVASKPPIRDRFALNRKRAVSARVYKPRTESSTRTLMTSGFGGGGGRGPRRPLGLSPGTLGTIFFWVLVLFAPGVILGAFNTLFLLVILGPLLLSLGVNIYNKINTIAAPCPVCGIQLSGLKNAPSECPSCGTMVVAEGDKFEAVGSGFLRDEMGTQEKFSRSMDSGVIDVEAIDIDD